MGRSSAGGGGGGRSSGGGSFRSSSGHRSSGAGRSSRSSSSGSSYSGGSSYGGGFGGSPYRRNIHIHNYGRRPYGGGYYNRPGSYRGGCGTSLLSMIILLIFLFVVFAMVSSVLGVNHVNTFTTEERQEIQISTVEREKLPDNLVSETDYFQDDLGWIGNAYKLEKGMKYFYQTTGVFPYLWITDNVDGDSWPDDNTIDEKLDAMYDALFKDEGHAIVMYLDAGGGRYITRCLRGASAKTVLDAEATEILLDYLDAYATSDMDDETYFATCFTKAADRMMSRTTNSKDVAKTAFMAVAAVVIVAALIFFFIRRRKLKLEQAKVDSEILNSKL